MEKKAQAAKELRIGDVARRSGCSVPTIRYYEEIGLLPKPVRGPAGQRAYDASAVSQLMFIRRCRELGFSLEQIRRLSPLADGRSGACLDALEVAREQLKAVRARLLDVMAHEATLSRFVQGCSALCSSGPTPECTMLEDLGLQRNAPSFATRCCR